MSIFQEEGVPLEILSYVFCTDDYVLKLNQHYLHHETYTDILTFPLSSPGDPIAAEIYISIERVKENALRLKNAFKAELMRVMVHGILHLCGYADHTPREKRAMRAREDRYLALLGST